MRWIALHIHTCMYILYIIGRCHYRHDSTPGRWAVTYALSCPRHVNVSCDTIFSLHLSHSCCNSLAHLYSLTCTMFSLLASLPVCLSRLLPHLARFSPSGRPQLLPTSALHAVIDLNAYSSGPQCVSPPRL